jgi:hypothetical protein
MKRTSSESMPPSKKKREGDDFDDFDEEMDMMDDTEAAILDENCEVAGDVEGKARWNRPPLAIGPDDRICTPPPIHV